MPIYLLRHGQTDSNKELRNMGCLDVPLNETGIQQARECGEFFKQEKVKFDAVYTSTLQRTKQTARQITEQPLIECPELNERNMGIYMGKLWSELKISNPDLEKELRTPKFKPKGGESLEEMFQRVTAKAEDIFSKHNENETVLVVSHAVPLRLLRSHIRSWGVEGAYKIDWMENCGISLIKYIEGRLEIAYENKVVYKKFKRKTSE